LKIEKCKMEGVNIKKMPTKIIKSRKNFDFCTLQFSFLNVGFTKGEVGEYKRLDEREGNI